MKPESSQGSLSLEAVPSTHILGAGTVHYTPQSRPLSQRSPFLPQAPDEAEHSGAQSENDLVGTGKDDGCG